MKARVKATGEIGIVTRIDVLLKDDLASFSSNEVEILQNYADATIDPDYWTKLEHQYAGMFLQALISYGEQENLNAKEMVEDAMIYAHTLVQKLKESK